MTDLPSPPPNSDLADLLAMFARAGVQHEPADLDDVNFRIADRYNESATFGVQVRDSRDAAAVYYAFDARGMLIDTWAQDE